MIQNSIFISVTSNATYKDIFKNFILLERLGISPNKGRQELHKISLSQITDCSK